MDVSLHTDSHGGSCATNSSKVTVTFGIYVKYGFSNVTSDKGIKEILLQTINMVQRNISVQVSFLQCSTERKKKLKSNGQLCYHGYWWPPTTLTSKDCWLKLMHSIFSVNLSVSCLHGQWSHKKCCVSQEFQEKDITNRQKKKLDSFIMLIPLPECHNTRWKIQVEI